MKMTFCGRTELDCAEMYLGDNGGLQALVQKMFHEIWVKIYNTNCISNNYKSCKSSLRVRLFAKLCDHMFSG